MGNRLTENAKRTRRALTLAVRCPDCITGGNAGQRWQFCDRHGCNATTLAGTRCPNSATYPALRCCGIHLTPAAIIGAAREL
jgi:hypothetical protein